MQYLDFWLRTLFANTPQTTTREREFGRLLKQCKNHLPSDLYARLTKFNTGRVHAVHGYIVGTISYESVYDVAIESDGLSESLAAFVLLNSGEDVTVDFDSGRYKRGDTVYEVAVLLQQITSRDPI